MLFAEHNIKLRCVLQCLNYHIDHDMSSSARTVARRRKAYGLSGSGTTTRALPLPVKRQLVLDQLAKDPTSKQGPKTIKEGILFAEGIHLTRLVARHASTIILPHALETVNSSGRRCTFTILKGFPSVNLQLKRFIGMY